jgi:hypothetical protein
MALFLVLLLVLLAVTGSLLFVLKVVLGVALGIVLGVALVAAFVAWRVRRILNGSKPKWRRVGGPSSRVEVLDPRELPPRNY